MCSAVDISFKRGCWYDEKRTFLKAARVSDSVKSRRTSLILGSLFRFKNDVISYKEGER